MKDSGYVNATKLCKDGGKRFYDWKRLDHTKELVAALESESGHQAFGNTQQNNLTLEDRVAHIPVSQSQAFYFDKGDNTSEVGRLLSGTYCHPLLIPHIACWISATFALKVSQIVNDYFVQEVKTRLEVAERQRQAAEAQMQIAQQAYEVAQQQVDDWHDVVVDRDSQIQELREDLISTDTNLTNKKAELNTWASSHAFSLLHLADDNAQLPYYAIRCKRRRMTPSINKLRSKYPNATVIYQNRNIPNAINLYSRLKSCKHIKSQHNYCNPTVNEAALLQAIEILCGTDKPPINVVSLNPPAEDISTTQPSLLPLYVFSSPPSSPPPTSSMPSSWLYNPSKRCIEEVIQID